MFVSDLIILNLWEAQFAGQAILLTRFGDILKRFGDIKVLVWELKKGAG